MPQTNQMQQRPSTWCPTPALRWRPCAASGTPCSEDPALRHRCAALKWAIVAGGPVDPMTFTKAKHDWITAALGQLGLPSGRRLYQDDPAGTAPATG